MGYFLPKHIGGSCNNVGHTINIFGDIINMFDVFDDNLEEDDDQEFLMGAKILEESLVSATPKRPIDNLSEESQLSLKRPRILDIAMSPVVGKNTTDPIKLPDEISLVKPHQNVKRKFGGPAGLLPNLEFDQITVSSELRKASHSLINDEGLTSDKCYEFISTEALWATQQQTEWSDKPAWIKMKQDILSTESVENIKVLEKFTIAAMLKQVKRNINFCTKKVPFLCVVLVSITNDETNSHSAIFQDLSGKIGGSIHHKVIEKYNSTIRPGCILVLRQFSIFSPSPKKHYICITENNVVRIYDTNEEGAVKCVEVKHLSWTELAKEVEMSLKQTTNDKEITERIPKTWSTVPNKNNISRVSSIKVNQASGEHFQVKDGDNLRRTGEINASVCDQQSASLKLPEFISNSVSCDKSQLSSPGAATAANKKYIFKRITPDVPVTADKVDSKNSSAIGLSLDLCGDFDDDIWKDDEFENLVKDINM